MVASPLLGLVMDNVLAPCPRGMGRLPPSTDFLRLGFLLVSYMPLAIMRLFFVAGCVKKLKRRAQTGRVLVPRV